MGELKVINTVIRMTKIKSFKELRDLAKHNMRLIPVKNSDNSGYFRQLLGNANVVNDVKRLMIAKNIDMESLRKDATIATEIVVSLSHDFFIDKELNFKEKFNKENTIKFVKVAMKYLIKKFGDNLISAYAHYDETSGHIHAVVVPILKNKSSGDSDFLESNYRLSCKDFFNKSALINLQAEYCQEFNDSSLNAEYKFEYKKNSKASHTTLNQFYKIANITVEKAEEEKEVQRHLRNEKLVAEFLVDDKLKALQDENYLLKSELDKLTSIIEYLIKFIFTYAKEKVNSLDENVLKFFKRDISQQEAERDKLTRQFEERALENELEDKIKNKDKNIPFFRDFRLKSK